MAFEKIVVVDSTALARPKVRGVAWLRRAALACGLLAAVLWWSDALASDPIADAAEDPIADALSLVAQDRYADAREILEPMLQQAPDSPDVRLLHGVLLARQGNLAEAVAIFEGLRNDHPAMFEAHNNLAVLYARVGRLDDAREALVAALDLRSDAVVYANLGDVYMKLAEHAYQRAHALRDQNLAGSDGSEQAAAATEPTELAGESVVAAVSTEPPGESVVATVPTEPPGESVAAAKPAEPLGESAAAVMPTEPLGESAATTEPTEPAGESPATATPTEASEVLDTDSQEMEEPEIRAEPEAAPAEAQRAICVRAGWFRDPAAAAEAADWMRSAGADAVEVRQEEQQIIKNYQVYLPPAPSREAAKAIASEMRGKGVGDIWIMVEGAQANGISLGVYRNKGYMTRRVAELEKLGYAVVTTANMRTATEYAVESRTGVDGSALEDAWNAEFQDHAIRRVDCADRT